MAWSGLNDDVHGTPYALLTSRPPMSRLLQVLFQKRGLFGYAKALEDDGGTSGVVPATRAQIDGNLPLGGARTVNTPATLAKEDDANLHIALDTITKHTYAADISGNGGPAY